MNEHTVGRCNRDDGGPTSPAPRLLIVGCATTLDQAAQLWPQAVLMRIDGAQITPALLAEIRPDRIVCPLISAVDACDVLARLGQCGYAGAVDVLCPPLPRPGPVADELARLAPKVRVHLCGVPPAGPTAQTQPVRRQPAAPSRPTP